MKKELVTLILLMLCIGSTAQEKLFKEGLVRARYAKNFYIARNDKGKGPSLADMQEYARNNNYILGKYTLKEINRFGDKQTVLDEIRFIPEKEYPQFVFEFVPDNYSTKYSDLRQSGACYIFERGNFNKLNNVKWSGTVKNGMLDGKGIAFYEGPYFAAFCYINGEFQNGIPYGTTTVWTFQRNNSSPDVVSFSKGEPFTTGRLSDNYACFLGGNGKWGFVSSNGTIAIPAKYDSVLKDFSNGRAEVVSEGKEIVIGKNGNYIDLTAKQKQLIAAEKARQDKIKAEEEQKRLIAERKAEEERRAAEAKEADLKRRIAINSNPKLWSRGCRLAYRFPNGYEYVLATLEEWSENRSKVKVKIVASPSSTRTLKGDLLEKNNTMWVSTHNEGWHLALDEEITAALNNDNSVKSTSSQSYSSSSGSGYSTCSSCRGAGMKECWRCGGKGYISSTWSDETSTCSECGGRGRAVCSSCRGTGKR